MTPRRLDTLSRLLDESFRLWWYSLRWTAPLALLAALPSLRGFVRLPGLAELQADPEAVALNVIEPLLQVDTWIYWGLSSLLWLWLAGAQALMLDRLRKGELPRMWRSIGVATLRFPLILMSALLYALLCGLPMLPMLGFNAWLGLQGIDLLPMVLLSMLGSLLVMLPIAWVAVRLMFMPYAAALEGSPPWPALLASRERAQGQWWRLLVFLSIPLTVYGVAAGIAAAAPLGLSTLIGAAAATIAGQSAMLLVAAFGGPMLHACLICAYRETSAAQQLNALNQA